jgi:hypothetical protein
MAAIKFKIYNDDKIHVAEIEQPQTLNNDGDIFCLIRTQEFLFSGIVYSDDTIKTQLSWRSCILDYQELLKEKYYRDGEVLEVDWS